MSSTPMFDPSLYTMQPRPRRFPQGVVEGIQLDIREQRLSRVTRSRHPFSLTSSSKPPTFANEYLVSPRWLLKDCCYIQNLISVRFQTWGFRTRSRALVFGHAGNTLPAKDQPVDPRIKHGLNIGGYRGICPENGQKGNARRRLWQR